ncbi:oligosaccharide flippase family protein [Cryobacterium sp. SO1]|uniref:oligosaccharide flippase family protein n=1 Tax=Cryobacterium sp. SO1 TaxID=1897061 RepID=UPI0010E909B1|nr:oligosaccharide flippase family protein [Cryobacterium sp. SO1]RZI37144.1 hypothetical protein BJQ95_00488 [Cryobacterium sp. SO1]
MSTARRYRVGGQFAWVSGGRILAALIQAIIMLVLVRAVAPAEFGFFAAVYGVMTLAQTFFDFGLPTLVIRERAKRANPAIVAAALRLNNSLSLIMGVLLIAVTGLLGVVADSRFFLLLPLGLWAAAERNADAWLGVVFADGDARINTANLVARRMGNLALFIGFTLWTPIDPVLAFGISSAAAACASWVFAHVVVGRLLESTDRVAARVLLRLSWPYWINSVATQARNLDATIIGFVAGTAQAGFYAAAARLTSPLRILPTSLASVLLPASSTRNSSTMRGLLKLVAIVVGGLGLFYLLLGLAVPYVVPIVLGEAYTGAILALQITAVGLVFAAAASLLGSLLQGVGLKHFVAGTAVLTTLVCLIGVGIGGLMWGAAGAACGLAFSYVVQSAVLVTRLTTFILRKEPNR